MDKSYVYWTRKELADLELKPIADDYQKCRKAPGFSAAGSFEMDI